MLSFHNKTRLKNELLELLANYQLTKKTGNSWHVDPFEKGSGFECILQYETAKPCDYSYFAEKYGIPTSVAMLEADLFYGLDTEYQPDWPTQFVEALPVGVDLNAVLPGFIRKIWFKKRLSLFSLCPPDKKHIFIPMKTRLLNMQRHIGLGPTRALTLNTMPEWPCLDNEDMKGDIVLRKLLIQAYATVRYAYWDIEEGPSLIPLLHAAVELFEHSAKQNTDHRVFFNEELYNKEGIAGINRQCEIESNLAKKRIKTIVQHLYAYDLLDVLKQQYFK